MIDSDAIIARARGCLGARFRLQGRDPAIGLDCVGLAAIAFDKAAPPARYALRGGDVAALARMIARTGLRDVDEGPAGPGDLLMVDAGACQLHLVVLTRTGFIHADAGLRRIVEVPGRPRWPILHVWRAMGESR